MSTNRAYAPSPMIFAAMLGLMGAAGLAGPAALAETTAAPAEATSAAKPTVEKTAEPKKRSKAEIAAFLAKCSQEADEKGLDVKKGKGAERKAFRRECMKKFGVVAK